MLVFPEAALMLNETAPEILKLCDGEHTIEGIVDSLAQRFVGIDREAMKEDVTGFLTRMKNARPPGDIDDSPQTLHAGRRIHL